MKKFIVTLIIVSGFIVYQPVTAVFATELPCETSRNTVLSQTIEPRWISTCLVVPSISASNKQISVGVYISPKKGTTVTKGNLYLEKKDGNRWKRVSMWGIRSIGTVNMVKSYRGATGGTYRTRVVITTGVDNIDVVSTEQTI